MNVYQDAGHAYLVCPRLLAADKRHGDHWSGGPNCRHGRPCPHHHRHEPRLVDDEHHRVADLYWIAGASPLTAEEWPRCPCGELLVWSDLDNPELAAAGGVGGPDGG